MPDFFMNLLRNLDNRINELIRDMTTDLSAAGMFLLIGISFCYGVIHSIGPGHGKSLVASFFLKEKNRLRKSLTLSFVISLIHTGSALILAFLLFYVLTGIKGFFRIKLQGYFMFISGIFILITGLVFLLLKIFHKDNIKIQNNKNIFLIGIAAGIIPCPAALMIMLFTLSAGIVFVGLISVVSISAGMFFLLTIIGIVSIKSREGLLCLSEKTAQKTEAVSSVMEYVSIGFIILIGLGMSLKMLTKIF